MAYKFRFESIFKLNLENVEIVHKTEMDFFFDFNENTQNICKKKIKLSRSFFNDL